LSKEGKEEDKKCHKLIDTITT